MKFSGYHIIYTIYTRRFGPVCFTFSCGMRARARCALFARTCDVMNFCGENLIFLTVCCAADFARVIYRCGEMQFCSEDGTYLESEKIYNYEGAGVYE